MDVPSLSEIRDRLANMAAADAHHDFDGSRGDGAFSRVYKDMHNTNIGTPKNPSDDLMSEAGVLNMFLPYWDGRGDDVDSFRETFLREGFSKDVPRAKDDPVAYEVKSLKVSTRASKSGGGHTYTLKPSEFMTFLEPSGKDVAFCIDATSVAFYDIFNVPEEGVSKRNAYFVKPREEINDGAGKVDLGPLADLTTGGEYSVAVHEVRDKYAGPVAYSATDLNDPPEPTFFSVLNIIISAVGNFKGRPSISMSYSNDTYSEPPDIIVQGAKDTSNTVSSITKKILGFISKMAGTDLSPYYKFLQEKRSGDWLQVLSCLLRERYPDLPDIPIILCTHDKICAAYAIAMGVNLLFAHIWRRGGVSESWLLYCRKKIKGETISEDARLANRIAGLPIPTNPLPFVGATYITVRDSFIRIRDAAIKGLESDIQAAINGLQSARGQLDIELAVKGLLQVYARIVWSRSSLPKIVNKGEEDRDTMNKVSIYETHLSIFNKLFKNKTASVDEVLQQYIDHIIARVSGGPVMEAYINKITIFGSSMFTRIFKGSAMVENATGLFNLFHEYLLEEERSTLVKTINEPKSHLLGGMLKKYTVFSDTAEFLIDHKGNGPKVPNWVLLEAATVPSVSVGLAALAASYTTPTETQGESMIPESIPEDESMAEDQVVMEGGAEKDHFELSSTYAPLCLLALRYQNKCEKLHRIEDLSERCHSPITTIVLMLNRLVYEIQPIYDEQQMDKKFEHSSEFMLKYLSQWILSTLKGMDDMKSYKQLECFLLGNIFNHASPIKDSPELVTFIVTFVKDMYGLEFRDFKVRDCSIPDLKVFIEEIAYGDLIRQLNAAIPVLINRLRRYEEDPKNVKTNTKANAKVKAKSIANALTKAKGASKVGPNRGPKSRRNQSRKVYRSAYRDAFTNATRKQMLNVQRRREQPA